MSKRRGIFVMEADNGKGWEPTTPAYHYRKEAVEECKWWRSTKGKPMKFRVVRYEPGPTSTLGGK